MSLRNTYGDRNYEPGNGPNVKFNVEPVYYSGKNVYQATDTTPLYWRITRESRRSYSYIGMDFETATSCANDLRAKYTRKYAAWEARIDDSATAEAPLVFIMPRYVIKCTADVSVEPEEGDAYRVAVSENDVDVMISREELTTDEELANLFQQTDVRNPSVYLLAVTSAKRDSRLEMIKAEYESAAQDFNYNLLNVDIKQQDGTWLPAEMIQRAGYFVSFTATQNCTFRLNYNNGAAFSREWTTTDYDIPAVTITEADCEVSRSFRYSNFGEFKGVASTWFLLKVKFSDTSVIGMYQDRTKWRIFLNGQGIRSQNGLGGEGIYEDIVFDGNDSLIFKALSNSYYAPTGTDGVRVKLLYDSEFIETNEVTVYPSVYADIASASATGYRTDTTFTVRFKASGSESEVLESANLYCFDADGTQKMCTRVSIAKDDVQGYYNIVAKFSGAIYVKQGVAATALFVRVEPAGEVSYSGAWKSLSWQTETPTRVVIGLMPVPSGTTVQINGIVPVGEKYTVQWGDGLSTEASGPVSHSYNIGSTLPISIIIDDVREIIGDVASPYNRPFLIGAQTLIKSVSVRGNVKIGTRAFVNCTAIQSVTGDEVREIGAAAFNGASSGNGFSASFKKVETIGQMAFINSDPLHLDISSVSEIGNRALEVLPEECEVTIGKTIADVKAMDGYPWGMPNSSMIICTDGNIIIGQ